MDNIDLTLSPLVVMAGSHRWQGMQDLRHFNHKNLSDLETRFSAKAAVFPQIWSEPS